LFEFERTPALGNFNVKDGCACILTNRGGIFAGEFHVLDDRLKNAACGRSQCFFFRIFENGLSAFIPTGYFLIRRDRYDRIRSKFDASISAAGGVGLKEARSAIFNGANIVVVNLVRPGDPWEGISTNEDIAGVARKFLETIE